MVAETPTMFERALADALKLNASLEIHGRWIKYRNKGEKESLMYVTEYTLDGYYAE